MRKFIKIAIAAAGAIGVLLMAAALLLNRPPAVPSAYFVTPTPAPVETAEATPDPEEEEIVSVGVYAGGSFLFAVSERQEAADALNAVFARYLKSIPAAETVMSAGFTRSITFALCAQEPVTAAEAEAFLLAHPDLCPFTAVTQAFREETGAAFTSEEETSELYFQGTRVVSRAGRNERLLRVTTRAYRNGAESAATEEVRTVSAAVSQQYVVGAYTGRGAFPAAPQLNIDLIRPHAGRIVRKFGVTNGVMNYGVDLAAEEGDTVVAAADGVVRFVGTRGSYGLLVEIDHGDGVVTRYAHCGQGRVRRGQTVAQGDVIALVAGLNEEEDNWTLLKTPFLHFEVWIDGVRYDPSAYLS